MTPRRRALALTLAGTLAACAWLATQAPDDESAALAAVRAGAGPSHGEAQRADASTAAPAPARAAAEATPTVDPEARLRWPALSADALAAWAVPGPAAAPPAPPRAVAASPPPPASSAVTMAPPPPAAPPLRYTLIGSLQQSGQWLALLADAERGLSVRAGDLLDGQWRVERVAAEGVDLVWLPGALPLRLAAPGRPGG